MTNENLQQVDIEDLRRRLGSPGRPLSQGELAERLGVHQATVSRMESDRSLQSGPTLKLLQILERGAPLEPLDGAA